MGVLDYPHGEHVASVAQQRCDVGVSAHERSVYSCRLPAVDEDVGFPVYAVEIEHHALAFHVLRQVELGAVPEVGVEERLGNLHQIVGVIGIGESSYVHVAHQNRCGHGGYSPRAGVVSGGRYGAPVALHLRGTLYAPVSSVEREAAVAAPFHGLGLRRESSATHHLKLAEHIRGGCGSLEHQHPHISALASGTRHLVGLAVAGRQLRHGLPVACVVRRLYASAARLVYPVKPHLVELALCAEVHVNPLRPGFRAHPRTAELR